MATFQLEFVSPEKLLLSRPVEMALLPAAEGEMGVLPGHAPMIVALRGGVISVQEDGQMTERLFVAGGFAEVTPTRVTILADEATPVAQLSRADAETAHRRMRGGTGRGAGRHPREARRRDGPAARRPRHAGRRAGGLTGPRAGAMLAVAAPASVRRAQRRSTAASGATVSLSGRRQCRGAITRHRATVYERLS